MSFNLKYLFVVLSISFPLFLKGQQKDDSLTILRQKFSLSSNDSVKYILSNKIINNLEKENNLNSLSWADSSVKYAKNFGINYDEQIVSKAKLLYKFKKYDTVIVLLNKLYPQIKDSQLLISIYYYKGLSLNRKNKHDSSIVYFNKAKDISQQLKDTLQTITCFQAAAYVNWRQGYFNQADSIYLLSYSLANLFNDSSSMSSNLNSLGAIAWGQGMYTKALKYYNRAMKISLAIGNNNRYSLIANNIGLIYKETKDYKKAMESYFEGLRIAKKEKYEIGIAYSYINIAQDLLLHKEFNKALLYCDSAEMYYKKNKAEPGLSLLYRKKAEAYLGLKKYTNSINYFLRAIKRGKVTHVNYHLSLAYQELAELYMQIKNFKLARQNVEKSLKLSIKNDYLDVKKDNYMLLASIHSQQGNYKQAFNYLQETNTLEDSLRNKEKIKQISELQAKYELDKIEREKKNLEREKLFNQKILKANESVIHRQQLAIFVIVLFLIVSLLFIIFIRKQKRQLVQYSAMLNENKEELELSLDKLEEAQMFKNKIFSIIGHDLRGPIGSFNTVLDMINDKDIETEKKGYFMDLLKGIAIQSHNLLENLLQWAKNENHEIHFKPQNVKIDEIIRETLILIHERAESKNIEITSNVPREIETFADYNTLLTIVRNILTNSLKFTPENGQISIVVKKHKDNIEICIKDNGVGMSKHNLQKIQNPHIHFSTTGTDSEKGSGLGMKLIIEFIKGNKGSYEIHTQEGLGTTFCFYLPKAIKN